MLRSDYVGDVQPDRCRETNADPRPLPRHLQHVDWNHLHDEIHARPPEPMRPPLAIMHVVMLAGATQRIASRRHLQELLREQQGDILVDTVNFMRAAVGSLRVRWELHTEFVTWTFAVGANDNPSTCEELISASDQIPREWLDRLPGECVSSLDLWVLSGADETTKEQVRQILRPDATVGSAVSQGQAEVFTDFGVDSAGVSRFLLFADALPPRRLGRLVQRLIEIETYRLVAMLGLPVARRVGGELASAESALAELALAIRRADKHQEADLLDRLTRLAAQVESQYAETHSRFSATEAYFELVDRRIAEIEESSNLGLQTLGEFLARRLTPARKTCEWTARRQDALSKRVSRVSSLLRTRVEIEQHQSTQALLEALNLRQDLQLRIQATVESLSVAAITYYIVSLVHYLSKSAYLIGWPLSAEATASLVIVPVAVLVWAGLRRMRRRVRLHRYGPAS